jgi:hypothetical protein
LPGFKAGPVFENHDSIERQTWFRAKPVNELVDGVAISPLRIESGLTAEDRGLGELKIGRA